MRSPPPAPSRAPGSPAAVTITASSPPARRNRTAARSSGAKRGSSANRRSASFTSISPTPAGPAGTAPSLPATNTTTSAPRSPATRREGPPDRRARRAARGHVDRGRLTTASEGHHCRPRHPVDLPRAARPRAQNVADKRQSFTIVDGRRTGQHRESRAGCSGLPGGDVRSVLPAAVAEDHPGLEEGLVERALVGLVVGGRLVAGEEQPV